MTSHSAPERAAPAPAPSLHQKTLRGLLLLGSGSAVQGFAGVIFLAVLARYVSPAEYGIASAAAVVMALSDSLSRLGLGPALVQRPELREAHIRNAYTTSMIVSVGLAGAVWLGADRLASLFRIDGLAPILRVLCVGFPLRALSVVSESLAQRRMQFGVISLSQGISYLLGFGVVGIGLALLGYGVWSLVWAQIAQSVLRSGIILARVPHSRRPALNASVLRELLPFGLDVTGVELLSYVANQGDKFVAGRWLGAEALGIYGRAYQLMAAPAIAFAVIVDRVLFPAMASLQNDRVRLKRAFLGAASAVALLTLPGSMLTVTLAPEIVRIWLGPGWEGAVVPLQILALATFLRIGYKLAGTLARALAATRRLLLYQALFSAAVLGFSLVLNRWGVAGIAIGVALALLMEYLLLMRLAMQLLDARLRDVIHAQFVGVFGAAVMLASSMLAAFLLRAQGAPTLVIVLVTAATGLTATGAALAVLWMRITTVDGREMSNKIIAKLLPSAYRRRPRTATHRP